MLSIQELIQEKFSSIICKEISLPEGHTLNDMLQNYGSEGIHRWMNENNEEHGITSTPRLIVHNPQKISYQGQAAHYEIVGQLPADFGNMRISLHITEPLNYRKFRIKIDLFDHTGIQYHCTNLAEKEGFDYNNLESDIMQLTDLLETHREKLYEEENNTQILTEELAKELTPKAEEQAIEYLSQPNILNKIDQLLAMSGIIGEEDNRLLLFILASTYKMQNPLHGLIQGISGGGKTHLINAIADCMPQEDIINLTRVTSKSFYYYQGEELINKLLLIQDLDGLDEEAQFALREMQSAKIINSSVPIQDRFGNRKSITKRVTTHFASLMATTRAEIYYDNMTRAIAIGIDESQNQTTNIIHYQNKKLAGKTDQKQEQQAKQILRNCVRMLKSYEVINPYADQITLPLEAKTLRRLNYQFQYFITQITLINQYQRSTDQYGRLITTKKDVKQAVELFFNAILFKIDELDGSTRQFYEKLKTYIKQQKNGTTHKFTQLEIRKELKTGKTTTAKYIKNLHQLEYVLIASGSINKGFQYRINQWDDHQKIKNNVKEQLFNQLKTLNER